jgi:hypothetical protein
MWLAEDYNLITYAQFAKDRIKFAKDWMKIVATCSLNVSLLNNVGPLWTWNTS